jgi:hypothetical protein
MSEAPSVANHLKPKTQKSGDHGREVRSAVGIRRLTLREEATEEGTSNEKANRRQAKG